MEILFRGKRTDNGEWVYGMLCNVFKDRELELAIQIHDVFEWVAYPVIPETVGQYIGIDDKNGRQIFGGDILESGTCVAVVVFEKGAFVLKSNGRYTHKAVILNQAVWQVIGNVTDNPELLEVNDGNFV